MRTHLLVHERLREARLVAFVVTEAAIAPHVDDNRLLEFLAKLRRHFRAEDDRLGIVAVDVENRRFDHLRHIGGIRRRARVARIGRKADLIVDDEMH